MDFSPVSVLRKYSYQTHANNPATEEHWNNREAHRGANTSQLDPRLKLVKLRVKFRVKENKRRQNYKVGSSGLEPGEQFPMKSVSWTINAAFK